MSKTLKLDDLNAEKEKLEGDKAALLKNLEEYQKAIQQTSTQIQAISGAIQTCEYFITKINPPQDPETIEEPEVGDIKE
jgi:predicted  nucleic acid-binding Zn-ribbon protein